MHKSIFAFAIVAFLTAASVGRSVQAQTNDKSLTAIARQDGYSLQWLLPDRAVQLYRPGVIIVIRPGATMYEVNNRVEFADAPPSYVNGDMLVSPSLAARLGRLASEAVTTAMAPGMHAGYRMIGSTGPITLDVRRQSGAEALNVLGHTSPNVPVVVTLLATISPDLPNVVLSRSDLWSDANGQFAAIIPVGPDYLRGSIVTVLASSAGATPAQAVVTLDAPSAGVTVPFDKPYCPNSICPI